VKRLVDREFWDHRHGALAASSGDATKQRRGFREALDRAKQRAGGEPDESYSDFLLRRVLARHLPRRPEWRVMEVGCAPGRLLVLFHRLFGYQPYGVEYSPIGAAETRRTFFRHSFDDTHVIESDFFAPAFQNQYAGRFDVVYSIGFIEHFDRPQEVIDAHLNLLAPGGYLVCQIPNLTGFTYPLLRCFANDVLRAHNRRIMRLPAFQALFEHGATEVQFCDYVGTLALFGVVLRHERSLRGRLMRLVDRVGDAMSHLMFLVLRGRAVETRWSPYLVYIARKCA
jgi:SAM-dependent methyltransferase